jgi:hypothetical protein
MSPANYGPIHGEHGTAVPLVVPPAPELATLMMHWLVTAPGFSTTRSQWVIAVSTTADLPGFRPCKLDFDEATHEIVIMPLDPEGGEYSGHMLVRLLLACELPLGTADAVRVQVRAAEHEVSELAPVLAAAIVRHGWTPEVTADPAGVRRQWQEFIEDNLSAIRSTRQHPQQRPGVSVPPAPVTLAPPGSRGKP